MTIGRIVHRPSSIVRFTNQIGLLYTPGAHGNHLSIAKGSAAETDSWLDTLCREGYLTREDEAPLHNECMEIMAILKSKILDLEGLEREGAAKIREGRAAYNLSDALDEASFPFVPDDYE